MIQYMRGRLWKAFCKSRMKTGSCFLKKTDVRYDVSKTLLFITIISYIIFSNLEVIFKISLKKVRPFFLFRLPIYCRNNGGYACFWNIHFPVNLHFYYATHEYNQ